MRYIMKQKQAMLAIPCTMIPELCAILSDVTFITDREEEPDTLV